jgi:precorrin-6A/cobalt-precorrin-6A reductase
MRLLILGGTTEASALARSLADRRDLEPTLSFAGRIRTPVAPPIPHRVGGFGGVAGLQAYLTAHRIAAVIDATHPFAAQMSSHARVACRALGVPLVRLSRPSWQLQSGDHWTSVADIDAAVAALGQASRRVLLTIGGVQLAAFAAAPQHHYIVRAIDPPQAIGRLPSHRLILARGPFDLSDETSLLREERVQVIVSKNSGGAATEAKLAAARNLGTEVIMIERPPGDDVRTLETMDAVLAWIESHRPPP